MSKKGSIKETYKLPSNGVIDGRDPEFIMRSMTTYEEKMRLGSKVRFFRLISEIIDSCVVSPENFNSYDLTLGDFIFAYYKLRTISYGRNYKMITKCPYCGADLELEYDLDKLSVKELPADFEPTKKIKLPRCGDTVEFRMLTARDIDDINKEAERIRKANPKYKGDPSFMIKYQKIIVNVNGESMVDSVLEKYVQDMEAYDVRYLEHEYNKFEDYGIDLEITHVCEDCGEEIKESLPVGENFFRPSFDD